MSALLQSRPTVWQVLRLLFEMHVAPLTLEHTSFRQTGSCSARMLLWLYFIIHLHWTPHLQTYLRFRSSFNVTLSSYGVIMACIVFLLRCSYCEKWERQNRRLWSEIHINTLNPWEKGIAPQSRFIVLIHGSNRIHWTWAFSVIYGNFCCIFQDASLVSPFHNYTSVWSGTALSRDQLISSS